MFLINNPCLEEFLEFNLYFCIKEFVENNIWLEKIYCLAPAKESEHD
jgi:hypothetical protein